MRTSLKTSIAALVGVATLGLGAGTTAYAQTTSSSTPPSSAPAQKQGKAKFDCTQLDATVTALNEKKEYATNRLTALQAKLAAATDDAKKANIQTRIDRVNAKLAKIDQRITKLQTKCAPK